MAFEDGAYYVGKIVDQAVTQDKNDYLKLIVGVALEGKLSDKFNPDGGVDPVAQVKTPDGEKPPVINVNLNFSALDATEERRDILVNDLERLGFDNDDIMTLDPEHPEHFSLVGKTVYVTSKISSYNGQSSVFWNFRSPKRYVPKIKEEKKEQVQNTARDLWRKARAPRVAVPTGSEEKVPF